MNLTNSLSYMIPGNHPANIISPVEEFFGLPKNEIFKKTRKREIVRARQIAMWLITLENISHFNKPKYSETARLFGNFDHATVFGSCRTVQRDAFLKSYREILFDIQRKIYGEVKYEDFQAFK